MLFLNKLVNKENHCDIGLEKIYITTIVPFNKFFRGVKASQKHSTQLSPTKAHQGNVHFDIS